MSLRCETASRNTLANAASPWQIYADFAQHLIATTRALYPQEPLDIDLAATVYAFDATTIGLCPSVYPWVPFSQHKAAVTAHPLLDLRGLIPTFTHISDSKTHEVNAFVYLQIEPGACYLLGQGYLDFGRLFLIHQASAFFVTGANPNTQCKRQYPRPVGRINTNVVNDQISMLTVFSKNYPAPLRRVVVKNETRKRITFLTNNFAIEPTLIAYLYRQHWQAELFFKWIKEHLRIKTFLGTSESAVNTHI